VFSVVRDEPFAGNVLWEGYRIGVGCMLGDVHVRQVVGVCVW